MTATTMPASASQPTVTGFDHLRGYQTMNVTTFRKTGVPVLTTTWFVLDGGKLYVWTSKNSGKVKRLRNNPRALVAPSTHFGKPLGETAAASTRVMPEAETTGVYAKMSAKYGLMMKLFALLWRLQKQEHVFLELTADDR